MYLCSGFFFIPLIYCLTPFISFFVHLCFIVYVSLFHSLLCFINVLFNSFYFIVCPSMLHCLFIFVPLSSSLSMCQSLLHCPFCFLFDCLYFIVDCLSIFAPFSVCHFFIASQSLFYVMSVSKDVSYFSIFPCLSSFVRLSVHFC
jgi:hypothetical protein